MAIDFRRLGGPQNFFYEKRRLKVNNGAKLEKLDKFTIEHYASTGADVVREVLVELENQEGFVLSGDALDLFKSIATESFNELYMSNWHGHPSFEADGNSLIKVVSSTFGSAVALRFWSVPDTLIDHRTRIVLTLNIALAELKQGLK